MCAERVEAWHPSYRANDMTIADDPPGKRKKGKKLLFATASQRKVD